MYLFILKGCRAPSKIMYNTKNYFMIIIIHNNNYYHTFFKYHNIMIYVTILYYNYDLFILF